MIELAIVCATIVLCSAFASVFYLSLRLARTNEVLCDAYQRTLDHALAINVDEREYMAMRFEADMGRAVARKPGYFKTHVAVPPSDDLNSPGITVPLDPETGEPMQTRTYTG